MKLSPICTPDGRPMWSAGGRHAYKVTEHKGFICSLEWVGEGKKAQAAMVIWPASNVFVVGEGAGMWVIGRRAITEFVGFTRDGKCTGSASEHCLREARESLPIMGKDRNDKNALHALVDVVVRFAPDLVLMPATPRHVRQELDNPAMWEVTTSNKDTGKVLTEAAV